MAAAFACRFRAECDRRSRGCGREAPISTSGPFKKLPADGFTRESLLKQLAAIDAGTPPEKIPSLRNPWLE
jgi:hypothetical protein